MAIFESLLGAGASILGGIFGNNNAKRQEKLQKEFAQNGISWKVADAKRAGIHPLAALGAQTISYTPQEIGSFGTGIAQAGQDIGRAIDSTRTPEDRVNAYGKTVADLQLQRLGLENELLSAQIAKVRQPATGPGLPSAEQRWLVDGQGQTALPAVPSGSVERRDLPPLVSDKPLSRVYGDPRAPYQEPGAVTDLGFGRTTTGYAPVPSSDMKDRIEDDMISELTWSLRNRVLPTIGFNYAPPFPPPEGKFWMYNPVKQEYQLYDRSGPSWWPDFLRR